MRIADLAHKDGRAGSGGAWLAETDSNGHRSVWHYSTLMLIVFADTGPSVQSIGRGSVSDQGGMNKLFRALGANLRYDRDQAGGGARVTTLG